jgi:uncharacterized protein (TIGR00251 family)
VKALRKKGAHTLIDIVVLAGSREDSLSGFDRWRERLIVRIQEKPIGGKANGRIVRFFSEMLDISSADVRILSGVRGAKKTLEVKRDIHFVLSAIQAITGQN